MDENNEEKNKEEKDESAEGNLTSLWKYLTEIFRLDVNHKGQIVELEIVEEQVLIRIREADAEYETDKSTIKKYWKELLRWYEEQALNDQPTIMPETISEICSTVAKEDETREEGDETREEGDEIRREEMRKREESDEPEKRKMAKTVEAVTKPMIREVITTQIDPQEIQKLTGKTNINKNNDDHSVTENLKRQESRMNDVIGSIGKICESNAAILNTIAEVAAENRKERKERKELNQTLVAFRDSQQKQLDVLGKIVDKLTKVSSPKETSKNNEQVDASDRGVVQIDKSKLKEQVSNVVKECFDDLKKGNSSEDTEAFTKKLENTVKLQIVDGNRETKRDYKLKVEGKFEYFYDYLTSELRTRNLLHIIDESISHNYSNEQIVEQKHKVRDIVINRIDEKYHSKIIKLQEPVEIIKLLKEIKKCEVNVTSSYVRKQLYSIRYVIGKTKAVEFCEKFDDIIRSYENAPGATPLSDDEKRDAFYNAVKIAVPAVQQLNYLHKSSKGENIKFEELKRIVMQDEAEKKAEVGDENEMRTANVAKVDAERCYGCGDIGHIAKNCPNKGEGDKCYNCKKFGHRAPECQENPIRPSTSRGTSRYGNTNNYSRGGGIRRGIKRQFDEENKYKYQPKRGKFGNWRGSRSRGTRPYYRNNNNRSENLENKDKKEKHAEKSSKGDNRGAK